MEYFKSDVDYYTLKNLKTLEGVQTPGGERCRWEMMYGTQ